MSRRSRRNHAPEFKVKVALAAEPASPPIPPVQKTGPTSEAVAPMFRQVASLMEQHQKLRAARDLLLPRPMSGEIAV